MKSKEQKRKECEARVEKWRLLSPQEKLNVIDQRLGVGIGAKKERAKLAELLPKPEVKPVPVLQQDERASTPVAKKYIKPGTRLVLR